MDYDLDLELGFDPDQQLFLAFLYLISSSFLRQARQNGEEEFFASLKVGYRGLTSTECGNFRHF